MPAPLGKFTCRVTLMERTPPHVAEARESLEQIVRQGQRAADMIQSVRSMFKSKELARVSVDASKRGLS